MMYFDIIYVVLTYRNYHDLIDFLYSIKKNEKKYTYKVIIVNSFYDTESEYQIKKIAKENECDFLSVENKGYSFGNNQGVKFACNHYKFNFLIISNADIEVCKLNLPNKNEPCIFGPKILTLKNKNQNPMETYKFYWLETLKYIGFKKNNIFLIYTAVLINKIILKITLFRTKKLIKVQQLHGAFLIFNLQSLNLLKDNLFDENLFLFAEENVLAKKSKDLKINLFYNAHSVVKHKEDGSINFLDGSISEILKKSYIYYYDNYVRGKK